jgi:hypothetical protein
LDLVTALVRHGADLTSEDLARIRDDVIRTAESARKAALSQKPMTAADVERCLDEEAPLTPRLEAKIDAELAKPLGIDLSVWTVEPPAPQDVRECLDAIAGIEPRGDGQGGAP